MVLKHNMKRSTKKKHEKKVKKFVKKLRDDYIRLKEEYDKKFAYLRIQLTDREYYINTILDLMNCSFRDTWDKEVSEKCVISTIKRQKTVIKYFIFT